MSKKLEIGKEYTLAKTKMTYIKNAGGVFFFKVVGPNVDGFREGPEGETCAGEDTAGLVGIPEPLAHLRSTNQIAEL